MSGVVEDPSTLFADRYQMLGVLGEGAFCRVHRALDRHTGRNVALKVLKASGSGDHAERFLREAQLCSGIHHPAVVEFLDSGRRLTGEPYAALSIVEGRTLRTRLEHDGALPAELAIRLMTQVLDALVAVHRQGIVHRDLKPENIAITETEAGPQAVLLDFGFATSSGDVSTPLLAGTPRYAAPEVLRGEPATERSDLYSWGLVLLECLTGKGAIDDSAAHDAAARQLESVEFVVPREAMAAGLYGALRRAIAKDPCERAPSAAELLEELGRSFAATLAPEAFATLATSAAGRSGSPAISAPGLSGSIATHATPRPVLVVSCRAARSAGAESDAGFEQDKRCETGACIKFFADLAGRAISHVSDGVTIVFGLPGDPLPQVEAVVTAALDWAERDPRSPVRWCVGVHAGEVALDSATAAVRGPEAMTTVAATAQRLDGIAGGGRVLVSTKVAAMLPAQWRLAEVASTPSADASPLIARRVRRRSLGSTDGNADANTRTPFLGRPDEFQKLSDAWKAASEWRSCSLLLQGEAGIGKSRLLDELRASIGDADWVQTRGTVEGQARPFHLLARLVAGLGGTAVNIAARFELDPDQSVPLLATLLGEALPAGYSLPLVTPDRFKELTLQVATRVFLSASQDEPLAVVLDDLHWADSATLEFVTMLLGECERNRAALLLLLGARPEFSSPWPEDKVPRVELGQLPVGCVEELIRAGSSRNRGVSGATVEHFIRACRGNPLFAEEAATLLRNCAGVFDGNVDSSAIPTTVDDLLAARLASLSPGALALAQIAAALGREFREDVIAAVARTAPGAMRTSLLELTDADLIVAHGEAPGSHRFRHDLLRDAAYASIPDAERAGLHGRIASTIRESFFDLALQRPAELALHFERAGENATAAELWHQAGTVAMATASYLDAQKHFARGLELISGEAPSPVRAQRELSLTTALATAHLSTEGFGAPSTREGFSKARVMCTALGREAPLEIVGGIFGAALARSDNEETEAILPLFESLAGRTDQPLYAFAGHQVLGVHACWSGRHARALEHTSAGMDLYRRSTVRDISWEYGFGLYCYGYGMSALYHLGFADRAEVVRQEMMTLAESSRHPYCMALALGFATTLTGDLRRPDETIELATRLLSIASEQHLYLWSAFAMCAQGQALVQLGRAEDGITPIRMGVGLLETLGFRCSHGYYQMYLVEALIELGEIDEALAVADQGLAFYASHWTRFAEPNMVRLRGAALEKRGDVEGAEREYRRSLRIAQEDGTSAYQQRAATSLAMLFNRDSAAPRRESPYRQ